LTYPCRDALLKEYWETLQDYKNAWDKFNVAESEYIDLAISELNTLETKLEALSQAIGTVI
jgi:hypothetical protein